MPTYTCPICMQSMNRDLLLFIKHTDVHIEEAQEAANLREKHKPLNRLKVMIHRLADGALQGAAA